MTEMLNLMTTHWPWWWLPILAGVGTALLSGSLGCFVVWQRMAYFGESLAHSALLGVALGLWLNIAPTVTVLGAALFLAALLARLQQLAVFSSDTLLGILSHTLLAAGLVLLSTLPAIRVNLDSLLFGDLLAVSLTDTLLIYALLFTATAVLRHLWNPLLALTVDADLAAAEGLPVSRLRFVLMLLMATVIAVGMKVVGVLLMTALLVIPAAVAQRHATSPEHMAALACITATLAVTGGTALAWAINTPVGPAIVLLAGLFFFGSLLLRALHAKR